MINVIALFLIIIFLLLVVMIVGAYFAWQKISIFLTWNTRYDGADYERAVTSAKPGKPFANPIKTEQQGRSIKPVDDLVDLADLDFETGAAAVEEAGR